ncbi:MAG: response regulator transcription factor [Deltaproteobacteria bacterium]|nr:response regulator transcription factor [Deltaproteobacteria bacterium]
MGTTILIVDDHQILRQGLRSLIEKMPGLEVLAEAEDGRTAVRLAQTLLPQLVIMDVGLPDLNGIEATRQVLMVSPQTRVIGLSMHSDRRFVSNMLKAGASGYLLKDSAFEELATAIKTVMAGKSYLSQEVAHIVFQDYVEGPKNQPTAFSVLTLREREVLQLIAEGRSNRQIAETLFLSIKTVETHRQQIMNKLNMHNVAELVRYSIREGLSPLES